MAWITSNSVSVSNGSKTVSVSGNVDLSSVDEGWGVQIGENKLVEASSGTAPNGSGVSTLTLFESWPNGSVSAATMKIIPNSGYQIALAKRIKSIADRTVDVMQLQHDYASKLGQVTATDPETNEQHVYNTLRQNQQSLDAALDNHAQSINELLANKAIDGDDTTPGALLAVGATVQQLDLTNSNVRYEPSVKPTLRADFANNKYTLYDSATNTYVDKAITDVFDITRDTPTTVTTPTGKVISIGIDKPAFDFKGGVAQGLRVNQRYTNLITWSEDFSNAVWIKPNGLTVDSIPDESPVESVNWTRFTAGSSGYIRRIDSISPATVKRTLYTVVKYDGTSTVASIRTAFMGGTAVSESVTINLLTGETNLASAKSYPLSQGAWLFSHTLQDNGTNNTIDSRLYPTDIGAIVGTDTVLFAVAQLTTTNYPMPYAKTEELEVTVEPDGVTRMLADELNAEEFSLFVQFGGFVDDPKIVLEGGGYGGSDRVAVMAKSNAQIVLSGTAVINAAIPTITPFTKIVFVFKRGGYFICQNGAIIATSSNTSLNQRAPFNRLNLSERRWVSNHANDTKMLVELYPAALSEHESIQLARGAI